MRLTIWLTARQFSRMRASGLRQRGLGLGVPLAFILTSLALTACESTRSFERTAGGPKIYFDQLSDAARAEARQKVAENLTRGAKVFDIEIGDQVEIFFHIRRRPTPTQYVIRVGDRLLIEFLNETENPRAVEVRPDGRISLPLIGPVLAAGQTPDALARQLQQRYSSEIPGAQITVNVTEPHSPLKDFLDALGSTETKGRTIIDTVLPDGTISVPLLPPLRARGRTLTELEREIDSSYSALGLGVSVSLLPRTLHPGSTFVLGEVTKPGRIELDGPRTVLMAVAQAGGLTLAGAMSSVRVLYVGADGQPRVRSVNLDHVLDGRLEEDMIVPAHSVIYVPATELAKTGRLLDAVLRDILRYGGFNIGAAYLINQPANTTVLPSTGH